MDKPEKKQEDRDDKIEVVETDEDGNEKSPEEKIKKIREKLKICEKERQEYLDGWQRSKADFINTRKDEEKARVDFLKFAKENTLVELFPALDSFEMAFANKEAWEKVDSNWRKGVEYIYSQLETVLTNNGFSSINPLGEIFDPAFHASVESVSVDTEGDNGKIVTVVQKGYMLGNKVVRPAKVKVGEYKERISNSPFKNSPNF